MAGLIGFIEGHVNGEGGTIHLYAFDDGTYDEVEEQARHTENLEQFFQKFKEETVHCLVAKIDIDSIFQVPEAR